jgi:hypothetical protein
MRIHKVSITYCIQQKGPSPADVPDPTTHEAIYDGLSRQWNISGPVYPNFMRMLNYIMEMINSIDRGQRIEYQKVDKDG